MHKWFLKNIKPKDTALLIKNYAKIKTKRTIRI